MCQQTQQGAVAAEQETTESQGTLRSLLGEGGNADSEVNCLLCWRCYLCKQTARLHTGGSAEMGKDDR